MIVALTGHRPQDAADENIVRCIVAVKLKSSNIDVIISGMANGFDLWAADEALSKGIDVWAARPWAGHGQGELYNSVISRASKVVNVVDSQTYPGPWCYHKRNHWMVDNADAVLAYLNPEKTSGGTYECVKYARGKGKPISNIWFDPPF